MKLPFEDLTNKSIRMVFETGKNEAMTWGFVRGLAAGLCLAVGPYLRFGFTVVLTIISVVLVSFEVARIAKHW